MNKEITLHRAKETTRTFLSKGMVKNDKHHSSNDSTLPEIVFITSYPPRECGIATYSQDLLTALHKQFSNSFLLTVCALESEKAHHAYPEEVKYVLNTSDVPKYAELARTINLDDNIKFVVIQHEFGFFQNAGEEAFLQFLLRLTKPAIIVFHTVLPLPNVALKAKVLHIATACESVVVMTQNSAKVLTEVYGVPPEKIVVIPHGTHLVPHLNKEFLKEKYGFVGKKVLSTFGLLSSGKGIETTLESLPAIISKHPDVIFLAIGKTHPGVIESEGERYRTMLEARVHTLGLTHHVRFINRYLPLKDLLEYLQLTDIYLFTSKDPHQAVSGTFSYAMSCGCPIISTPIPHAREVLREDTGIIIDFESSQQLADGVHRLLNDEPLRLAFSSSTLQRIVPTAWENSAIAHALLLQNIAEQTPKVVAPTNASNHALWQTTQQIENFSLHYRLPTVSLEHVKKMTTKVGMIQFSKINQPDIDSGYTLDDNARALIVVCMHHELTGDEDDVKYIQIYLNFIQHCQQPDGDFLNYVDSERQFTEQNNVTNLADANGRAIWALGYVISRNASLPVDCVVIAEEIMERAMPRIELIHSTRAMAFAIKGLYYGNLTKKSPPQTTLIKVLANRLLQMYRHEAGQDWQWYESYLTYANSVLSEAMLCAWLETGDLAYKNAAQASFDFLLSLTFTESAIKVISNRSWLHKGRESARHGEQPIDVAYTILALSRFYHAFKEPSYAHKITFAFNWFLGNNHLHQIIYNPCTGGCYDGLEETHVNLNQGAESTLSYLMARLTMEKYRETTHQPERKQKTISAVKPPLNLNLINKVSSGYINY